MAETSTDDEKTVEKLAEKKKAAVGKTRQQR